MISKIGRDTYFSIHHWMITELELDGYELLVYALIYNLSFFGTKEGFYGSQETLRDWLGAKSRTTITSALAKLVEKGYLIKDKIKTTNNNFTCQYYAKKYNDDLVYFENIKRETDRIITDYCQQNQLNKKSLKLDLFTKEYIDVETLQLLDTNADSFKNDYPQLYDLLINNLYLLLEECNNIQLDNNTEEDAVENVQLHKEQVCTKIVQPTLYKNCTTTQTSSMYKNCTTLPCTKNVQLHKEQVCTKIVQPPVQKLYNSCTKNVHNNQIIKFNNKTSSSGSNLNNNSEAEEIKKLLKKIFNVEELPFSDNFYPVLQMALNNNQIFLNNYAVFLKWAYEECIKHNPNDIFDYFYKTVSKSYFITKYKHLGCNSNISNTTESKTVTNAVQTITCPVCNNHQVNIAASNCPVCNCPVEYFKDSQELENYKIFYRLPENQKEACKKELDAVVFDIRFIGNYKKERQKIYDKYKIL